MTNEELRILKGLVDQRRRELTRDTENTCVGCGADWDARTAGCVSCGTRHAWRERRRHGNKALVERVPGVCACGCGWDERTWGCVVCLERHKKRRRRVRALHQGSRPLTAKTDDGHVRVSLSGATSGGTQQQEAA